MVVAKAHTTKCWGKLGIRNEHGEVPKRSENEHVPQPGPTDQRGTTSNVCIHPHEIKNIANRLPRPFDTLRDEIAVIIVSNDNTVTTQTFKNTPFLVRRQKILEALIWLKANNRFYRDIEIDMDALEGYPADEDLSARAPFNVHVERPETAVLNESTSYTGHSVGDATWSASSSGDIPVLSSGTFDIDHTDEGHDLRKIDALRRIKNGERFLKTSTSVDTINPREHPHVYAWLWPTLFPYGIGVFEDPIRST
ncbi:hypothetical protein K435DRAFT_697541, partial [Dendrothele bispora CBS 962.96]